MSVALAVLGRHVQQVNELLAHEHGTTHDPRSLSTVGRVRVAQWDVVPQGFTGAYGPLPLRVRDRRCLEKRNASALLALQQRADTVAAVPLRLSSGSPSTGCISGAAADRSSPGSKYGSPVLTRSSPRSRGAAAPPLLSAPETLFYSGVFKKRSSRRVMFA